MPSNKDLVARLQKDFPNFIFNKSNCFSWSPNEKTVNYDEDSHDYPICLFHELAHGILKHSDYCRDIELVKMESEAWYKVVELAKKYEVKIDENDIQSTIDTYRDWLHSRSICPNCKANGIQSDSKNYSCLACSHKWRVNEARTCGLKRYRIDK